MLTHSLLVACGGRVPAADGQGAVNLLWSDVTSAYAPLLADMTDATGIKILQTIVPYNQRLDKINTAVLGGATSTWSKWTRCDGTVRCGRLGG
jgi:hypothetical protein